MAPMAPMDFKPGFPIDADSYLIAYSGGRRSSMVLDLAVRLHPGKKIIPWHMYLLPGLDITAQLSEWVRYRYGLQLYTTLDWRTSECIRQGKFGSTSDPDRPWIGEDLAIRNVRSETGVLWIGYGHRFSNMLPFCIHGVNLRNMTFAPLKQCSIETVETYCQANGIETGLDIGEETGDNRFLGGRGLGWLKSRYIEDYRRVVRVFPRLEVHGVNQPIT